MPSKQYRAQELRHALKKLIIKQSANLSDSEKMEVSGLYSKWNPDEYPYTIGTIVKYGVNSDGETQLYEVIQDHISQLAWLPNISTSLYRKIGFDEETGYSIWTQPLGATDAYNNGDIVVHNSKTWVSITDSNVWEPGVYGWQEQT